MPSLYPPIDSLYSLAASFLERRIQTRTLKSYNNIVDRYIHCCIYYKQQSFPITTASVSLWIAYLSGTCSAASIANYLSALGDFCRANGYEYTAVRMSFQITSMMKGIRVLYPRTIIRKAPITIQHLNTISRRIDHNNPTHLTFFAMCCTAFFGLLRLGEIVQHEDSRRTLQYKHVSNITQQGLSLRLPASKTDLNFQGSHIFIPRLASPICPVSALSRMLSFRPEGTTYLFLGTDGNAFTRKEFLGFLKQFLPEEADITGHSFRAGGATWAAEIGMSALDLSRLGRWSSEAFRAYIRSQPLLQHLLRINPYYQLVI